MKKQTQAVLFSPSFSKHTDHVFKSAILDLMINAATAHRTLQRIADLKTSLFFLLISVTPGLRGELFFFTAPLRGLPHTTGGAD